MPLALGYKVDFYVFLIVFLYFTTLDNVVAASELIGGTVRGTVRLPCDTSPPTPHNPLLLTVWFKDHLQDPIYR